MATDSILQCISVPTATGTNLSASQYCGVTINSSGQAVLATAAKNMDGIVQTNGTGGMVAEVAIFGKSKAIASGNVAVGDLLQIATGGKFVATSGGTVVAKALSAGADGNVISVLILKSNAVYA